jgi:phosphoesterase RecJ-like protein
LLEKQIEQISKWLHSGSEVLITSHHNPDGDAIGSLLAMYHLLNKMGITVHCLVPNDYPEFLKWMPGSSEIRVFKEKRDSVLFNDADIIYCLDYNSPSRISHMEKYLRSSGAKKILIDHHPDPDLGFFDSSYSTVRISSTAEMVFQYITAWRGEESITREIAASLFVGIMTDTGSFSFNCSYPSTFHATATMLETGIDAERIHRLVYDNYSESRLRLLGFCLSEKMTVIDEYSLAYISLTKAELEKFGFKPGDTEGIVNYPLSISDIRISVLMLEREDKIRLSFRSKGDFPVNRIANEYFSGGGHKNAAGGDSFISMDETILKLLEILPKFRELIDSTEIEQNKY